MPLAMVPEGKEFVIRRISGNDKVRRHLASLGILEGRTLEVIQQSPSGTVILINGTRLALNSEVARTIMVG